MLSGSAEGEGHTGAEFGFVVFAERTGVVIDRKWPVGEGAGNRLVAHDEILSEVLVVDAHTGRVVESGLRREVEKKASAVDFAVSQRIGAAKCRDLAVLARGLEHERDPVDGWRAGYVVTGKNEGITRALRGDLEACANGVSHLPQIVVAHRGVEAQRRRIRAVAVVQLHAAVQGEFILHCQLHIDSSRRLSNCKRGSDLKIGCLVEGDDVALHIVEIRHAALCERRGHFFDPLDVKETRSFHAQAAYGRLGDLQHNDAGIHALGWHGDGNGLVPFVVVGFFQ